LRSCSVGCGFAPAVVAETPHFWCGSWQCTAVRSNVPGVRSMCSRDGVVVQALAASTASCLNRPAGLLAGWPFCLHRFSSLSLTLPPGSLLAPSFVLCTSVHTSVSGCWLENQRPFVVCCPQQRWCGPPPDHKERILSTHCVREPRPCLLHKTYGCAHTRARAAAAPAWLQCVLVARAGMSS
jgi:hypothetical protein